MERLGRRTRVRREVGDWWCDRNQSQPGVLAAREIDRLGQGVLRGGRPVNGHEQIQEHGYLLECVTTPTASG